MTPPLDREALASEFRRVEATRESGLNVFLSETPHIELVAWIGDLIGVDWRAAIQPAPQGCSVYIYRSYSPTMQMIFETRRRLHGY
jgi:hypothetical protein